MKRILIIPFLFSMFLGLHGRAQSSAREIENEFYKADPQISIFIHHLPAGWTFRAVDGLFIVSAPDSAWVLEGSPEQASLNSRTAREEQIRKNGRKILPQVVLGYENRWTADQVQTAKIGNAAIDDEIRQLPGKYKLLELKDTALSTKSRIVYTPRDDKDAKRIRQYEKEMADLLAQKKVLPDFHSGKYSLYLRELVGAADETHWVAPASASLNVYTVLSTLREICGK